ncbi:hypothetical protein SAMN05421780_11423 [Flexibacter flexilis DSM 6793]|uniref:Uncharacterized protein n=1 Tax=Flexibacter flexilis DSM 6793 TaxID=927664 RepID=A0A1I1NCZ1_9BACT|nr:hypothetical protein [Flexibacter flexilis]SFC95499.1 hypothetical protein SAMN05421780_11423 [Flexibacter flexilis DSM 6793]
MAQKLEQPSATESLFVVTIYRPYNNKNTGYQHIDTMYSFDTSFERSLAFDVTKFEMYKGFEMIIKHLQKNKDRVFRASICANKILNTTKKGSISGENMKLELMLFKGMSKLPDGVLTYEKYQEQLGQLRYEEMRRKEMEETQW